MGLSFLCGVKRNLRGNTCALKVKKKKNVNVY